MIDERFPNWLIDVEKGTIYSLKFKKYISSVNKKDNYVKVCPPKGYKSKECLHRIIWMVANGCDIPEGYDIHHIDGNKLNNSIYNLELIEHKKHVSEHSKNNKNMLGKQHSEETKRKMSESHKGKTFSEEHRIKLSESKIGVYNNQKTSKKVAQYTLDDELVKIWESTNECGRNGFNQGSVSACCRGERKQHKGYIWKYYNEERDVA